MSSSADFFRPGSTIDPAQSSGGNNMAVSLKAHWLWIAGAVAAWYFLFKKK